jgi:hypothetical protein
MDNGAIFQNRKSRRSHVLMSATLETDAGSQPVSLRDLSSQGALVKAKPLPIAGTVVRFRKGELDLPARVAWVERDRAGIAFDAPLDPESVLRHVPRTAPRAGSNSDFRRPGLRCQMSEGERKLAEQWIFGRPNPFITD